MEFGVLVPQGWRFDLRGVSGAQAKWETVKRVSRGLDTSGWDSLWVYDHFHTFPRKDVEATFIPQPPPESGDAPAGPPDGPAVLCIHGFPEGWMSWRPVMHALGEARMYAPDMRGYGDTDRPRNGYDVFTLTDDIAALIGALGLEPRARAPAPLAGFQQRDGAEALVMEEGQVLPVVDVLPDPGERAREAPLVAGDARGERSPHASFAATSSAKRRSASVFRVRLACGPPWKIQGWVITWVTPASAARR